MSGWERWNDIPGYKGFRIPQHGAYDIVRVSGAQLLHCPFCGGRAEMHTQYPDPDSCTGFGGFDYYVVTCTRIECQLSIRGDTPQQAQDKWNGRC